MTNPADRQYFTLIGAGLRSDEPARPVRAGVTSQTLIGRLFAAIVLICAFLGALWIGAQWEPRLLPIRVISVDGEIRGLSRETLQQQVASHLTGGIVSQNLEALRARVTALPWVRDAAFRRVWPDRLILNVTEHQVIARWGEDGLVTGDGVIFHPNDRRVPAGLPRLSGPDQQASAVVERLQRWEPRLAELGLLVDSLSCDERGDWRLELLGGPQLNFGIEQLDARFDRFLAAFPRIEAMGSPERIDLRYSNGLAVRWSHAGDSHSLPAGKRMAAINEHR